MIIERQKQSEVLTEGTEGNESIAMTLDMDSAQFLMQMLSKNIYSDAIGSTIRETASNALDSHRFAKVDKPIIVTFKVNKDSNYEFSVEDFGNGMDDGDVRDIISKYGASTKRLSANELGMWGLGFKSPLAYSSSFYFIARKDGIERKYMMYEGEDNNTIDLLYESVTEECNGTKVIVPVKYADRQEFINKIKEQLAYFEDVYFDVPDCNHSYYSTTKGINNGFVIHRSEDFQISELTEDRNMHLCLDNVYYPLDFAKLGIDRIDVPVGLRFGLSDGIFPTPNRETVRYTQEAKVIILDKIKKVADFFVGKYNETIHDTDNILAIFKHYNENSKYVTIEKDHYDIRDLIKYSSIQVITPNLIGVSLLNLKRLSDFTGIILSEYRIQYEIERGRMREMKNYYRESLNINFNGTRYIFTDRIGGNKREYIKEQCCGKEKCELVKKTWTYSLYERDRNDRNYNYYNILELRNFHKSQWRQMIKEFQYIQGLFTSKFIDLDKLVIPQQWIDDRKVKRASVTGSGTGRRVKLEGEAFGKEACDLERFVNGRHCKFVPVTYKLEKITTFKHLTIYTSHENDSKLDNLYEPLKRQKIKFVTFSDRELKILSKIEIHNLMSYEKFMEGTCKPFRRVVTAYLIQQLISENSNVFNKMNSLSNISANFVDKLNKLQEYVNIQFVRGNNDTYSSMLEVAKVHSLYDGDIYPLYMEMKKLLERLRFLEPVMSTLNNRYGTTTNDEKMMDVLKDLFRYYKFRMDYKNYEIKLNEEITEEELTDETVEQLTS